MNTVEAVKTRTNDVRRLNEVRKVNGKSGHGSKKASHSIQGNKAVASVKNGIEELRTRYESGRKTVGKYVKSHPGQVAALAAVASSALTTSVMLGLRQKK